MLSSVSDKQPVRLRATGKKALHLRYLVEDFFGEVIMNHEGENDFSLEKNLFVDHRHTPPLKIGIQENDYLITLHKYFSLEREDLGGWGILHGVRPLKWVHQRRLEGHSTQDIRQDLLERGRLRPDKIDLLFEVEQIQKEIFTQDRDKLSLYISIPFCPSICHFCCFHSVPYTKRLSERYLEQLLEDLTLLSHKIAETGRVVDVIYIGGGTPTSLRQEQLSRLLLHVETLFPKRSLKEYTIEAGRIDSFTEENASLIADVATRVCINPQSFSEDVLRAAGRPGVTGMHRWMRYFKERGLTLNTDLIAGLSGESAARFSDHLDLLTKMNPDNITVHQLSKKRGSQMGTQWESNPSAEKMTRQAYEQLKKAGYHPYYLYRQKRMVGKGENIGYAKRGTESIYNIRMMEDHHEIVSAGSNSVLKMIREKKLIRLTNFRDVRVFLSDPSRYREHVDRFFERNDEPTGRSID